MEVQSSLRKQAKFSRRMSSNRRILRSPMPDEHPGHENYCWSGKYLRQYPTQQLVILLPDGYSNLPFFMHWNNLRLN